MRGRSETLDNVLIGGFVVAGEGTQRFAIRAIAPSLAASGITGVLADPTLEVYDSERRLIAFNDNWRVGPDSAAAELISVGLAPTDDREAAVILDLAPGSYTAIVRGTSGQQGVAIVESFELAGGTPTAHLINASLRGPTRTGENVLIGGLAVRGNTRQIIVRALGPSLATSGVPGMLSDPMLRVYNASGQLVAENDNWRSTQEAAITATGLAPGDDRESAVVLSLEPGNYTMIVSGVGNTVGISLLEVYEVSSPSAKPQPAKPLRAPLGKPAVR